MEMCSYGLRGCACSKCMQLLLHHNPALCDDCMCASALHSCVFTDSMLSHNIYVVWSAPSSHRGLAAELILSDHVHPKSIGPAAEVLK